MVLVVLWSYHGSDGRAVGTRDGETGAAGGAVGPVGAAEGCAVDSWGEGVLG